VAQIEPQLRNAVIAGFTSAFANANVPFLDMAANQAQLATQIAAGVAPAFEQLGLKLESFTVENLSLPDELQKRLDERISMNMIGDMRTYAAYQAAQSIPIAAANQGGIAGLAAGLGAGMGVGGMIGNAMAGAMQAPQSHGAAVPPESMAPPVSPSADSKFCINCGTKLPSIAKFCSACGTSQGVAP
jgi:membrane protease subunit (stomatin/prohibitin family)